ncbi:MAG: peptide ABC transporter substrate-binding protein, partial [Oscillospiraceae bacterium]
MFKRTLAMVLSLTMCAAMFAGCGKKEESKAPTTSGSAPAASDSASTAPTAPTDAVAEADKGTLVWNIGADPKTWDPGLNTATDGSHLDNNMFEGLMEDIGGGKLEPAQAESYKISDDKMTYTFTLRKDLKWSDGSPLTAKDFEYSWKRVCDPATAAEFSNLMTPYIKGAMEFLEGKGTKDEMGVKALDDLTLEVKLVNPVPYFLNLCSFYTYYPVKESVAVKGDGWEKQAATCISNGPFMLEEYKTADHINLVKNPNYRKADEVKLERINGLMIVEATTTFNGYKAGKIHLLESSGIPVNEIPNLEATDPYFTIAPQAGTWYAIFNVDVAPFDNPLVRKAFTLAIDNKKITDILKGGRLPATGFIAPVLHFSDGVSCRKLDDNGMPTPEYGIDPMKANKEEAMKLLAEAGYPEGKGLPPVSYTYNTNDGNKIMAEALQ